MFIVKLAPAFTLEEMSVLLVPWFLKVQVKVEVDLPGLTEKGGTTRNDEVHTEAKKPDR